MPIYQNKFGNLALEKNTTIVHQVNCQGVMNSGIAKDLRMQYPNVFEDYKKVFQTFAHNKHSLLGKIAITPLEDVKIISLFGQLFYGYDGIRYTKYDALYDGFLKINEYCLQQNINKISIPKIGCGLGGGDFRIVKAILDSIFADDFNIDIWDFKK